MKTARNDKIRQVAWPRTRLYLFSPRHHRNRNPSPNQLSLMILLLLRSLLWISCSLRLFASLSRRTEEQVGKWRDTNWDASHDESLQQPRETGDRNTDARLRVVSTDLKKKGNRPIWARARVSFFGNEIDLERDARSMCNSFWHAN